MLTLANVLYVVMQTVVLYTDIQTVMFYVQSCFVYNHVYSHADSHALYTVIQTVMLYGQTDRQSCSASSPDLCLLSKHSYYLCPSRQ